MKTRDHESRDSGILIILILLLGFICIILASGWALRFAPSWRLDTSMGSNLNPNGKLLTDQPVNLIEPVDPAILTNPAWINIFLTPGAVFATHTPLSTSTATLVPVKTSTPVPTLIVAATNTLAVVLPTNTKATLPPPVTPKPSATNTPVTPLPSADLQITKTDGVTTYTPGGTLTYTITVRNNGTNAVTGAVVTDAKPGKVTNWTWVCTSQNGGATGCSAVAGSTTKFTDKVNLPNGASIVYTVTANIAAGVTGNLTNKATINVPAGYTDPTPGNNSATDIDAQNIPSADLGITKDDNATDYEAGSQTTYTIVVSNNGPSNVIGATVTDTIPTQIANWTWACTSQTGGATGCNGVAGSTTNFMDIVDLPSGATITYTVTANISAGATGALTNTANINVPAGYTDPAPGNDAATDTDQLITANILPYGLIGTAPDCPSIPCAENIPNSSYLTLRFGSPLTVGGHAGYDLVYYPDPSAPTLRMDIVILQIGDGANWYTILYWGDGSPDANTNINPADCPSETDNCVITPPLINFPGISIELDGVVPNGTYPYIRIISLPDSGDGVDVDAISVLP